MEPRRILFVIRSYRPDQVGGGAKSVQTLAEGLAMRGHDVHVLRLAPKGQERIYLRNAAEAGIVGPGKPKLHVKPIRNLYWPYDNQPRSKIAKAIWHAVDLGNVRAARDFRKFLAELRPDVVNTSIIDGFSPSILREVKRSGAKLIHTMRDYYLICARSGMYRDGRNCDSLCRGCRMVQLVNRRRTLNVDLFLSNSAYVADTHKRFAGIPISTPCAVQWNVNDSPLVSGTREVADGRIVFGYIGRLSPTKGVEKLLEAARQLGSRGRAWSLVIAGDGSREYVATLHKLAEGLSEVKFLGWVAAEDFYSQVDVVICPSVYNEPLPRVIYEAYGFAIPVIASRVGGNPEVVIEGRSGELYDGDSSLDLANSMEYFRGLSNSQYSEYSAGAIEFGANFTPEAVLDSFERHLKGVCDVRRGPADERVE